MKKLIVTLLLSLGAASATFAQEATDLPAGQQVKLPSSPGAVIQLYVEEGNCQDITIIHNKVEKSYSREWIASMQVDGDVLVFSKRNTVHRWDIKNAVLIEKGLTPSAVTVRIYLE